ncbi:mannosyltransferase putative-domain-containing protein [Obelidium mucronatum]|nr:mannosyltransferase putative-domain-containing protein [Obelidium mucronatum]
MERVRRLFRRYKRLLIIASMAVLLMESWILLRELERSGPDERTSTGPYFTKQPQPVNVAIPSAITQKSVIPLPTAQADPQQSPETKDTVFVDDNARSDELKELEATIDLDQTQLMDFLNGEKEKPEDSVFGGSLSLSGNNHFDPLLVWSRIYNFSKVCNPRKYKYHNKYKYHKYHNNMENEEGGTHFLHMNRRVRSLSIAYMILHENSLLQAMLKTKKTNNTVSLQSLHRNLQEVVDTFAPVLFPWFPTHEFPSLRSMQLSFINQTNTTNESGIVISAGKQHMNDLLLTITGLRQILNCTLPIEIHYAGPTDLPSNLTQSLDSLPNVKTVNLLTHFPKEMRVIDGWSVKPFSILASRFQKVIFMDADVLFFKNPGPQILNHSAIFKEHGHLFFTDRSMDRGTGAYSDWFHEINPYPSRFANYSLRYPNKKSFHEQESGVVAMDKSRTGVFLSLLYACKMNSLEVRKETYTHMWGDKETFWLSMELLRIPFKFAPSFGGVVGYKDVKGSMVCGSNFHVDEDMKPFWWNGGILIKKGAKPDLTMRFEVAAFDSERDVLKWEKETETVPFCFKPLFPKKEVMELTEAEKRVGLAYVSIWKTVYQK